MANVLIIDDSKTSRKILRKILEKAGHEIIGEAANGQEGVQMFQKVNPDVVTLDITMPLVCGVETLKMLKALKDDVKIVMVTASGQNEKMIECVKEGACEFITKPINEKDIIEVMQKIT